MSISTQSKIIAAVGITALVVSVFMTAAFFGYLYLFRDERKVPEIESVKSTPTPQPKKLSSIAPSDIKLVEFTSSIHSTNFKPSPVAYFGNVNPQNFSSSLTTVRFSADGSADKRTSGERTVNGVKTVDEPKLFTATITSGDFADLATVLAKNDFVNLEDSATSTSLPIRKTLRVMYNSGKKVIETDNMDKNTLELTEILAAFQSLELKAAWNRK